MYEYKVITDKPFNISESSLNTMGSQGWELISIIKVSDDYIIFYFKKVIPVL